MWACFTVSPLKFVMVRSVTDSCHSILPRAARIFLYKRTQHVLRVTRFKICTTYETVNNIHADQKRNEKKLRHLETVCFGEMSLVLAEWRYSLLVEEWRCTLSLEDATTGHLQHNRIDHHDGMDQVTQRFSESRTAPEDGSHVPVRPWGFLCVKKVSDFEYYVILLLTYSHLQKSLVVFREYRVLKSQIFANNYAQHLLIFFQLFV